MRKKVLFVAELFWPHVGGAEVLLENLCLGLSNRGIEVVVVTTKLSGYKAHEIWRGIEIHRVNCINRYGFTFLSLWKIYGLAKNTDIIHTITFNAALPAWIIAKILNKPCHITVLEVWGDFWRQIPGITIFHRLFEKFIMSLLFDKYIAISEFTKAQMQKIYNIREDRIKIIYPGVDYKIFDVSKYDKKESRKNLGLSQKAFYYLYFGRPGWAKGLDYLLMAVRRISQKIPRAKLILIISKTPRGRYGNVLKLIKKLDIGGNIIFLSSMLREELVKYIVAVDCVVVPSLSEGFGFSAAEACALGVPVIATRAGSLPEVISGKVVWIEPRSADSIVEGVSLVERGGGEVIPVKTFLWDDCIAKYADMCN